MWRTRPLGLGPSHSSPAQLARGPPVEPGPRAWPPLVGRALPAPKRPVLIELMIPVCLQCDSRLKRRRSHRRGLDKRIFS